MVPAEDTIALTTKEEALDKLNRLVPGREMTRKLLRSWSLQKHWVWINDNRTKQVPYHLRKDNSIKKAMEG